MLPRLCKPLLSRSFFLIGPRGSGKTWLLRELFKDIDQDHLVLINLLKDDTYLELLSAPGKLANYVRIPKDGKPFWVVIDEVQRVPKLLHEVHELLERQRYHGKVFFALTGSSARKLKRVGVDLLGGRALLNNLYPLSVIETEASWSIDSALNWGTLPAVVSAESDELRGEILRAYVGTYIKEEIKEEQIVRNLEPFIRFLEAAAQSNGETIIYSKIGAAALVDQKSVARYYEVLEDTLLGFFLPAYTRSARERAITTSKFYLFDVGVKKAIDRTLSVPTRPGSSEWGRAFEHNFILECLRLNSYYKRDAKLSHLRTKDGAEIDLIVEFPAQAPLCVEIKSSTSIPEYEVNKLRSIASAVSQKQPIMVYGGEVELMIQNTRIIPWQNFLVEFMKR